MRRAIWVSMPFNCASWLAQSRPDQSDRALLCTIIPLMLTL